MRSELSGVANVYVTGDLVALQNVLDGLNSSQLSSTAISFIVSFVVLLLLTRRPVPAIVVLDTGCFGNALGCRFNGCSFIKVECSDRNGDRTFIGYWNRLCHPHVA